MPLRESVFINNFPLLNILLHYLWCTSSQQVANHHLLIMSSRDATWATCCISSRAFTYHVLVSTGGQPFHCWQQQSKRKCWFLIWSCNYRKNISQTVTNMARTLSWCLVDLMLIKFTTMQIEHSIMYNLWYSLYLCFFLQHSNHWG